MAGKIVADIIESAGSQISLNVGNVTILTASSTGLTLIPTTNVNVNLTNSIVTLTNGSATSPGLTFSGNTRTGLFMPAANTVAFTAANTESMRIDSSGRVGIGTNNPSYVLDVQGTTATQRISSTTGTNAAYTIISNTGQNFYIGLDNSSGNQLLSAAYGATLLGSGAYPMVFGTNNTERMRISSGGVVLIGATAVSAAETLKVTGAALDRVVHFENTNNTSGAQVIRTVMGVNASNASSYHMVCSANGDKLYIYGNGNVVNVSNSYGALSDIKLKENIVDATSKLADLMQVKVRNYNLIGDTTKQIGVVAQELETVFPAMIDESPDIDGEGGNLSTVTKSVKYSVFVPILIKAIQELKAIVDAQAVEIAALKAK